MLYKELVQIMYKEILKYQINVNNLKEEHWQKQIKNIVGFSTVCNNLKIDYLMSILEGCV